MERANRSIPRNRRPDFPGRNIRRSTELMLKPKTPQMLEQFVTDRAWLCVAVRERA